MKGIMKTAVMTGIGKMAFEERPIPQPKDDEALVKIEYVGVCGSDLHYYESGAIGNYVVKPPFVLGHECGGVVVVVGKNGANVKPADRVALGPGKTGGPAPPGKAGGRDRGRQRGRGRQCRGGPFRSYAVFRLRSCCS